MTPTVTVVPSRETNLVLTLNREDAKRLIALLDYAADNLDDAHSETAADFWNLFDDIDPELCDEASGR